MGSGGGLLSRNWHGGSELNHENLYQNEGAPAEIRAEYLSNTSPERCHLLGEGRS
jgi:hypothetical protein